MSAPRIAVLATLDTKGAETAFLKERIAAAGGAAVVIDLGVVGEPACDADVERSEVASEGGTPLPDLLRSPTRQEAGPVMVAGASRILERMVAADEIQGVIGLGGTQGTTTCCAIMRTLPYGLPKIMVSTIASGDTSPFVDVKDITMMFSVGDILGLNPFMRQVLANAAGAAVGMAGARLAPESPTAERTVVGMTNLGVLTEGAMHARDLLEQAGCEVIVFHAVGSGGRAMEQMMAEGIIGAVFDYALGEVADDVFGALRAGGPQRLRAAGRLGLPQVLCPGGAEHVGLLLSEPDVVPERWRDHQHVFHSPVILAPRLKADELRHVARSVGERLAETPGRACMMLPLKGTSRYAMLGGPLHDPEGDAVFFEELKAALPETIPVHAIDAAAEDPKFVEACVGRLLDLLDEE